MIAGFPFRMTRAESLLILHWISNGIPACGDYCEIAGHSGAAILRRIVVARQIHRLGQGICPNPRAPRGMN